MNEMFGQKKKIIVVVLIAALIISTAIIYYSLPEDTDDDDLNGVDRTVKFPEDEGVHDEPFESWEISLSLDSGNAGNENYKILIRVVESDFQEDTRLEFMLVDEDEVSGERYYSHKTTEGQLSAESDTMDMNFRDEVTENRLHSTGEFRYQMESTLMSNIQLDLELQDTKEPTLLG
ncbi:MAG: hypothetical protein ACOC53_06780, partial [Candidatus Saliniplasma sp.]